MYPPPPKKKILLIKTFVERRGRYRCRRGFLKLPILFSTTKFSVRIIMATGPTRGVITYRSQQNMLSWAKNSNLSSINLHVSFNDDDALTYSVNWSMQLKVIRVRT